MKILMICHFVPFPPVGGSLQRSFNLLKEVSKNHEIHLLALNQRAILPDEKSLNESIAALKTYCRYIKVFDIPTDFSKIRWYLMLFFNLFSLTPYSVWRFKSAEMAGEIKAQVRSNHFDLVHMDTVDLAQYAELIPDIPKILNHHNVESELIMRRGKSERNPPAKLYLLLQAWKLRRYERSVIGKVDVNLTVSEGDGKTLAKLEPNGRYELVPNGTDVEYFAPRQGAESNELVFAGGMNWYPNKDAMIYFCEEIFPLIKKVVPDSVINIVGQSPPPKLLVMAKNDDSIRIHGHVSDVRDYLAQAAVYVVPIRVGGGTRLKILDAFSCGKALVSTSAGCEGIDITPEKDILIGDSPREFAEQVVKLLGDKELRKKLEMNARKLVEEKYSWTKIGDIVEKIYNGLVK